MVKALAADLIAGDPIALQKATKEELVEAVTVTQQILEDMEAQVKTIKTELFGRIETSGEIIGDYSVVKAKLVTFPDVTLEQAQEFGAVKQAVNVTILKNLYQSGIEVPHKVTEYLIIKEVNKKAGEVEA